MSNSIVHVNLQFTARYLEELPMSEDGSMKLVLKRFNSPSIPTKSLNNIDKDLGIRLYIYNYDKVTPRSSKEILQPMISGEDLSNLWRTSGRSAGCIFPVDSSRPAADSVRVGRKPENLQRICRGSAASTRWSRGLFGLKKPKKFTSLPKKSESGRRGLLADYFGGQESNCPPRLIFSPLKNPPKKILQSWSALKVCSKSPF